MKIDKLNMVIENSEEIFQGIMDKIYELHEDKNHNTFLNRVEAVYGPFAAVSVMFGNFNYQVENGGLSQYYYNGYSEALPDLISMFETLGLNKVMKHGVELLNILKEANSIIESYQEDMNDYDEEVKYGRNSSFYSEDDEDEDYDEIEEPEFDGEDFDSSYYEINEICVQEFEEVCRKVMKDQEIEELKIIESEKEISMVKETKKPRCKLIGKDGNVFNLMGIVSATMRKNGLGDKVKDMQRNAISGDYNNALQVFMKYVEVC